MSSRWTRSRSGASRAGCAPLLPGLLVAIALIGGVAAASAASCPQSARFDSSADQSTVDLGWTGVGHGLELGRVGFTVALGPCASLSDGSCGTCAITGLVKNAHPRRCSGNTARPCEWDSDCNEAGSCETFLRPPVAVAAGGTGWCLVPGISTNVRGSFDVSSGAGTVSLPLRLEAFEGNLETPCPLCVGDPTAGDGRAEGTCASGAQTTRACDAGTTSAGSAAGAPSLDCPPDGRAMFGRLTDGARPVDLATGIQSRVVKGESPSEKVVGRTSERSLCDACSNDATRPCATDNDCNGGVCGGTLGAPTASNACEDGICESSDGIHGVCARGPFDRTCVAEPSRHCLTDRDCGADDRCQVKPRRCYPGAGKLGDSVTVRGQSERLGTGKTRSTLAALFCVPPGRSATANQLLGLPGLGRIVLSGAWTLGTQAVEVLP